MEHRRVGGRGVARQDRLDDGGVLQVGPRRSALGSELGAPERRQAPPEPPGEFAQNVVVRAEVDQRMEVDVGGGVGLPVVARDKSAIVSWRPCSRRRSIGVMLTAARRAQVASISAIAPNSVSS